MAEAQDTQGSADRQERGSRGDYARFSPITTRWLDNDMYGHVNNVVYYLFFDTAVNGALIAEGLLDPVNGSTIGLVVETSCRYHASIAFPEAIEAGIRVARLGTSSIVYEVGLFRSGEPQAVAEGRFVHVIVDRATRRPVPIPPPMRTFLQSLAAQP